MKQFFTVSELGWQVGAQHILQQISFSLQPGEIVGLIGPNGAGKSSLLKLLQRQFCPTAGQIHLLQQPLQHYSRRQLAQLLAVVSQHSEGLHSKVLDVVRLGLLPHKNWYQADKPQDVAVIADCLR